MPDVFNGGAVGLGSLITEDQNLPRPTDDVGVRHDAVTGNDKAAAGARAHLREFPGFLPVGRLTEVYDFNDRAFSFNGLRNARHEHAEEGQDYLEANHNAMETDSERAIKSGPAK